MLIENGDGTGTAGPLDILLILHNVEAGTFHAAFFEESPPPGPIQDVADAETVRFKSKMHHTRGAPDLAGAQAHLDELGRTVHVPEGNVARDRAVPWDGQIGFVWVIPNWRRRGEERKLVELLAPMLAPRAEELAPS